MPWGKHNFESNASSKNCCESVTGNSVIRDYILPIEDCHVQCITRLTLILGIPVFECSSGISFKKSSDYIAFPHPMLRVVALCLTYMNSS